MSHDITAGVCVSALSLILIVIGASNPSKYRFSCQGCILGKVSVELIDLDIHNTSVMNVIHFPLMTRRSVD